jgi:hypothetical protein
VTLYLSRVVDSVEGMPLRVVFADDNYLARRACPRFWLRARESS